MPSFSRTYTSELQTLEDEDILFLPNVGDDYMRTDKLETQTDEIVLFEKLRAGNSRVERDVVLLAKLINVSVKTS